MQFEFAYIRSYSFGIETINRFILMYAPVVSSKPIPDSSVFRQKDPKPLHLGAAHTYMAYIREYPPSPGPNPFHDW